MIYFTIAALLYVATIFLIDTGGTQRPWHATSVKIALAVAVITFILELVGR